MRSLKRFFREEMISNLSKSSADHLVVTPEEAAIEMKRCEDINNEWNAQCEAIRNDRLKREFENRSQIIEKKLEEKIERDENELREIENRVRSIKEIAHSFITAETLEQAIEFALSNPVDVNFAIDLKRNIHQGRTGLNTDEPENAVAASNS